MKAEADEPAQPSAARRRFLEAARREFAAKGYAGASIRGITEALGMRKSAFYAHFKGKQELYEELFREAGPGVVAFLAESLDVRKSVEAELSRLAQSAIKAWTSDEARAATSIVLREAFGEDGHKRQQMLRGVLGALDVLEGKLNDWQKSGQVRKELDPRALAYGFVAPLVTTRLLFFSGSATASEQRRGRQMVVRHVSTFLAMLVETEHQLVTDRALRKTSSS